MIDYTRCAGVMIGRGALSAPWIFRDIWSYLNSGQIPPTPIIEQKCQLMRDHFYNLVFKFDRNIGTRHHLFFRQASNDRTELRTALSELGRLYYRQGAYAEAEPLLERALALAQRVSPNGAEAAEREIPRAARAA